MNDNNNQRKLGWKTICTLSVFVLVLGICILQWAIHKGLAQKDQTISIILTTISIILTIISIIVSIFSISKSTTHNNRESHDNWLKRNHKQVFTFLLIIASTILIFTFCFVIHENRESIKEEVVRQDSIQRHFNKLVESFENQPKDLYFGNAYQKISEDLNLVNEIICMLNEHPELSAEKKEYYIRVFEERKTAGINTIKQAIFSNPPIFSSEEKKRKYIQQKDSISQMKVDPCL